VFSLFLGINQICFIFGKSSFSSLSKYKNATKPSDKLHNGFVGFILIGAALVTIVYWTLVIKKMVLTGKPKFTAREQESKNWVYDLIKGDQETVFVAEVPGPEDKIMVRLIDGTLYVRGSQGFSKEVPIEGSPNMQIADFKYRNGVLTLRISTS
jgi:hypothetical protein